MIKKVMIFALATIGVVYASKVKYNYDDLCDSWPSIKIPGGNSCGTGKN